MNRGKQSPGLNLHVHPGVCVTPDKGHDDHAVFPPVHMQMAPFNKYCFFCFAKGETVVAIIAAASVRS